MDTITQPHPTRPGEDRSAIDSPAVEPWRQAGEAWEHAALDWAHHFEPYSRDAIETVMHRTEVGGDTRLLDVACGSGLALGRAARLGARTSGLDASARLLEIAARRAPGSDLVHGDMFVLPWADGAFDVVTSFNGIWGGCDAALAEMGRVVRPGGHVALTFWGAGHALDLLDYFLVLGATGPAVADEMTTLAEIGVPGVAEAMLSAAGLDTVQRGATTARLEWPDAEVAHRALRSPGIALPPLGVLGEDAFRVAALDSIEPFRHPDGSYTLDNELTHVIARRPA